MNLGLFFDTETTGIPDWKTPSGGDNQPHITQLAAILLDMDTRKEISSIDLIVKPDGWTIPQECVELNGLTTEYCGEVGIPEGAVVECFLALSRVASRRYAYNTTFDNRIIRIATKRYFNEDVQEAWHNGEYSCVMMAASKIIGGKYPKLSEAYRHFFGTELLNAHTAMADTRAAIDVWFAMNPPAIDQF